MPVPLVGFQSLLWSMAFKAGLNPDATFGTVNLKDFDVASFADFLNDAVLWAWKPDSERPEIAWPYTVNTILLNSGTTPSYTPGSPIVFSTISYGDWWRIWSADPRAYSASPTAYQIGDTWDNSGIYPRSSVTAVFVFYRPMRPMFTYISTVATYPAGALYYAPDGNVYKALGSYASTTYADPTKWTVQAVPDPLVRAVLAKAEALRVKSKGSDPAKLHTEADALLAAEKARALPVNGFGPPWSSDVL